jgi:hypothetical protein
MMALVRAAHETCVAALSGAFLPEVIGSID